MGRRSFLGRRCVIKIFTQWVDRLRHGRLCEGDPEDSPAVGPQPSDAASEGGDAAPKTNRKKGRDADVDGGETDVVGQLVMGDGGDG